MSVLSDVRSQACAVDCFLIIRVSKIIVYLVDWVLAMVRVKAVILLQVASCRAYRVIVAFSVLNVWAAFRRDLVVVFKVSYFPFLNRSVVLFIVSFLPFIGS